MKKLMMAAAIVCAAVAAQAATVDWKTGTGMKPDGSTTAAKDTISIFVWSVSEDIYNKTAIESIWNDYGNASIATMSESATATATTYSTTTGSKAQIKDVPNSTTLYGLVIVGYDSNKDGTIDYYAANKATGSVNDSGSPSSPTGLAKFVGGGTSGTAVTWQSVPEPTSGLLLLLGVAGLALKRKRA